MILSFLGSKIGKLLSSALAILSVVGAVFLAGRRDAKKDQEIADLKDYVDTQERINHAVESTDADAALERLRRNGQLRD